MRDTRSTGRACSLGLLFVSTLLAAACLNGAEPEAAPGCTMDSECKGSRLCIDGRCEGEASGGSGWGGSGWGGSGWGGSAGGGSGGAGGPGGAGGHGEPGRDDCERACDALTRCGQGDPTGDCVDRCVESLPVMGAHAWDCLDCLQRSPCRNIQWECGRICL